MHVNRLPTKVLRCNIKEIKNRGRQPKTWVDNIKEDMKIMNMDIRVVAEMTTGREKWRQIIQHHCQ